VESCHSPELARSPSSDHSQPSKADRVCQLGLIFIGNNIRFSGDMASRGPEIRLSTDDPRPEERPVAHADPIGWTFGNRARIMRSLYTILIYGCRNRPAGQPRAPHLHGPARGAHYSQSALQTVEQYIRAAAALTAAPDAPRKAGEWCTFCRVAASCEVRRQTVAARSKSLFFAPPGRQQAAAAEKLRESAPATTAEVDHRYP
jgi:hypothetical protein